MEKIRTHKDLDVWKKSIDLVAEIYEITKSFPKEEIYGITNQIRRAAVSIPSNIAEGAGRNHDKEFIQFLYIAMGSSSELETQIFICKNLKYIGEEQMNTILEKLYDIRKMLSGLLKSVISKQ
ncbi:MAG: four helix bundle protein [Ignavibacteria bacterium]